MSDTSEILFDLFQRATGVTIDNRTITGGEIFFGLKGEKANGGAFAQTALEKGALACVVDDAQYKTDERCVVVNDSLAALQQLAAKYRQTFLFPVLALTGSNGKTTTKELMRAVLAKKFNVFATKGNLNNHIGVPLTLLSVPRDCNFAIIEMGANHQKEIEFYCTIAHPDCGLITNIGKAHLEGFGGEEGVLKGKSELFKYVMRKHGTVFFSSGQSVLFPVTNGYNKVVNYGLLGNEFLTGKKIDGNGFAAAEIDGKVKVYSYLAGDYNIDNLLAAACAGKYFGIDEQSIADAIASYLPDNNRSEVKEINGNYFILDAYNANPSSMRAALENLRAVNAAQKIAIIGDMLELGEYAHKEHQEILALAKQCGLTLIVTVGPEFGQFSDPGILHFTDAMAARTWWQQQSFKGATILLKGSRGIQLEKILS